MRTFDFTPLYRSTVGFDRLFDLLDSTERPDWAPYDIEKLSEDEYRISMAVAGFKQSEIEITQEGASTHRGWANPLHIVNHPTLPLGEKRSLLASWASDLRAVLNYPSLRRLDDGRLIHIDEVLDALKLLDGIEPLPPRWRPYETRPVRRGHWSRLSRVWKLGRNDDDDDDPPPAVAADIPRSPLPNDSVAAAALAA